MNAEVRADSSTSCAGAVSLASRSTSLRVSLPIVPVVARSLNGAYSVETCALLDSGSTGTFCSAEMAQSLRLTGQKQKLSLSTLSGNDEDIEVNVVSFQVSDLKEENFLTLPSVYAKVGLHLNTERLAPEVDVKKWHHLSGLNWPQVKSKQVGIVIGLDMPQALMPLEIVRGKVGEPYASRTILGWTINGPVDTNNRGNVSTLHVCAEPALDVQLHRFWKLEDDNAYTCGDDLGMSAEDKMVLQNWTAKAVLKDNHYEVPIPFNNNAMPIDNKIVAEQHLRSLQFRLAKDPELRMKYENGIEDLLRKGYAEKVPNSEGLDSGAVRANRIWYLLHHPVMNVYKPGKIRIVFDCAAQYQGKSLNDQVYQGPDMTNKLIGVLVRFRQDKVALMADVDAMFYQVFVSPCDRDVLRFLWWPEGDSTKKPEEYRMTVHPFGGVWSPSCAGYILRRTAEDNRRDYSMQVVKTVKRNFYVDDCLKSVETEEEATQLVKQLKSILAMGGFHLSKWVSNSREVMTQLPAEERSARLKEIDLCSGTLPTERSLGVSWNVEDDTFGFEVSVKSKPETRRGMLSILSSLYDPMGLVSPFVLRARIIVQDLTCRKVDWDDELPQDDLQRWRE